MDLTIEAGEFITLLGPSGCGKTTTLRIIAGLLEATEGEIKIKGQRVNDLPIHRRNLGIVFQNYALFPHKTIFNNVAFGLKYRNVSKAEIKQRVMESLELVQLPDLVDRYPRQLSGGQQQRIALARAIAIQPDVLLLDEPLSALDANLREDMRVELKRLQHQLGLTTIFVTHDQSEALAMSDRVVVMRGGRVEQVDSPSAIYNHPRTEFVADFLGNSTIKDATVTQTDGDTVVIDVAGLGRLSASGQQQSFASGDVVRVVFRAERIKLDVNTTDAENTFPATIRTLDYQGQVARYFLDMGKESYQCISAIEDAPLSEGAAVTASIRPVDVIVLKADR
ncbi:MAG: ABC transporter ATP-binding protein [Gammaproteobacteria bacterium]|nr:ABC transporter ATP-binding protein [Gammaproteobacteria bacterium]